VTLTISGYLRGVGTAILFGVIASSALVLGALAGGRLQLPKRVLAGMLAFAAGALIRALTFEMFEDSYQKGGIWRAALGLGVGAVVFTVISQRLDRMAEGHRKDDHGSEKLDLDAAAQDAPASPASVSGAAGLALLAAATLDGVPENLVLGSALGEGSGGIALLAAIFVANFPEALVGSASMREQGRSPAFILGTWTVCAAAGLRRGCWCRTTVASDARDPLATSGLCRGRRPGSTRRHAHARGLRAWRRDRRAEYRGGLPAIFRPFAALSLTVRRHPGARLGFVATATPSVLPGTAALWHRPLPWIRR